VRTLRRWGFHSWLPPEFKGWIVPAYDAFMGLSWASLWNSGLSRVLTSFFYQPRHLLNGVGVWFGVWCKWTLALTIIPWWLAPSCFLKQDRSWHAEFCSSIPSSKCLACCSVEDGSPVVLRYVVCLQHSGTHTGLKRVLFFLLWSINCLDYRGLIQSFP